MDSQDDFWKKKSADAVETSRIAKAKSRRDNYRDKMMGVGKYSK